AAAGAERGIRRTGDAESSERTDTLADPGLALLPCERWHGAVDEAFRGEFRENAVRYAIGVTADGAARGIRCVGMDTGSAQCLAVDPVGAQRVVLENDRGVWCHVVQLVAGGHTSGGVATFS